MKDNHQNIAPWDEGFYQTGTVAAPRRRDGLVMGLLVAVVLLGGVVTILGLLNVRLFVALKRQEKNALQVQEAQGDLAEPAPMDSSSAFEVELSPVPQTQPSAQEIYADCADTIVDIQCGKRAIKGVVMHRGGYIVTNRHAVIDGETVSVRLADRREYTATVVGSDVMTNLAVLHIEAEDLTPATFGDSQDLQVGDKVCAIADTALADGTIQTIYGGDHPSIHTDTPMHSGKPLLDCYGRVVGISIFRGGTVYVIPSATVKSVVEQLVHQGFVSGRPTLGIQCEPISQRYQCYYDLPAGLYISGITTASAGQVLESGDVLLSLEETPITNRESLTEALCNYQVGDDIRLTILRGGEKIQVTVTVEEATTP